MNNLHSVIKRPLFTEKGTFLKDNENKLYVEVDLKTNKIEIKKAFEEKFKVKVEKVAITMRPSKWKKFGKSIGKTRKLKKAIITLKEGEKLDFIEGV
ncbi:MAG: 50S ribosomal protein L23 [Candidatus Magnetobacterium sp. LHC-1]|uniref:Large ribosomal subunit protein uL23 n=1 Tax=Candidatus Magnetobacterium casense TaxID=1455061 RepID=A0ABS6RXA0_9BACT|nr:50S ribosomal protein L23 [Candidatus Magnetobacterium casensis]MBF0607829.1 50S ribosomal protein L23 [Nitrospirota bacterium]MBV6340659.1 50S ribosomal protein L23 [Candidatus Magnetobacterium casensis]